MVHILCAYLLPLAVALEKLAAGETETHFMLLQINLFIHVTT